MEGSHLINWIHRHKLYKVLFCRRQNDGCRGFPIKASCEWLMYEEERIFLGRFFQTGTVNGSGSRPDLYSRVFRRSLVAMICK